MRKLCIGLLTTAAAIAQIVSMTISAPVFTGTGLNDATSGGSYVGVRSNHTYTATICSTGSTDGVAFTSDRGTSSGCTVAVSTSPVEMFFTAGTLSGASWSSGVATYTTSAPHQMQPGEFVTINGATASGYNISGFIIASVPTTTTFTVAMASNPGTWTSGGTVYGGNGITIQWGAVTGHHLGDPWTVNATGNTAAGSALESGVGAKVMTQQAFNRGTLLSSGYDTFAHACLAALMYPLPVTLNVDIEWYSVPAQACPAALNFTGGVIQPASMQTVTLSACPIAGRWQIFDTQTLGGHVAPPANCTSFIEWWGALANGNTAGPSYGTDNSGAIDEASKYAYTLSFGRGIYATSAQFTASLNGQQILCSGARGPGATILLFTGATHGIDIDPVSGNLQNVVVDGCQIATVNAGGGSALIADYESLGATFLESFVWSNNYITAYGSGNWFVGPRVRCAEGGLLFNNRIYAGVSLAGIQLGDSSCPTTAITLVGNLVGAIGSTANLLQEIFAYDIVGVGNYWQNASTGTMVDQDDQSTYLGVGDSLDNGSLATATVGIDSSGFLQLVGLTTSGSFVTEVLCEGFGCDITDPRMNGSASSQMIKFHQSGEGSLSGGTVTNFGTGAGVLVSKAPLTVLGGGVNISTQAGNAVVVDSRANLRGVYANSASGYALECDTSYFPFNTVISGFVSGTDLAHMMTSSCNTNGYIAEGTELFYNDGANQIPDIHAWSTLTITGGGPGQTVTLPSGFVKITGNSTDTISTINFPPSPYGQVTIIALGGGSGLWSFAGGGNIANGATSTIYPNVSYTLSMDGGAWYVPQPSVTSITGGFGISASSPTGGVTITTVGHSGTDTYLTSCSLSDSTATACTNSGCTSTTPVVTSVSISCPTGSASYTQGLHQ